MTEKVLYWSTLVAAVLSLLLFIVSVSLISGNNEVREKIGKKQEVINVAKNVLPINRQLSQALYEASIEKGDLKIRDLLTSQGFTIPEKTSSKSKKNK
ncbi:MAG TPA: hypothetical protein DD400_01465 [Rhodospirillaceae bacterium]|nr:hypothetical protein [Rhodospirillaceae bacterium]